MFVTGTGAIGDYLIRAGAVAGGSTAFGLAIGLVAGAIAQELGCVVDPWKLAAERAAPLGALFGIVFVLAESIPVS